MRTLAIATAVAMLATGAPAGAQSYVYELGRAPMGATPGRTSLAPQPPAGAAANLAIPAREAAGGFATPNRDLGAAEAAWHLRAALNVAALGCRDADELATIAAYNQLLRDKRAVLAGADAAVRAVYRGRYGAGWQDRHDGAMTRVYNFFAQPPAQADFCVTARNVLAEVAAAPAAVFVASAPAALARIEAPFLAFYDRYDRYRVALAQWQGAQGPRVVMATAVAAPVAPRR